MRMKSRYKSGKITSFPTKFIKGSFPSEGRQCGICGKTDGLVKSKCCDKWICGDIHKSKKRSCYKGHESYTLCMYHHREKHKGKWQDCQECKKGHREADYVWYATNKYNLEKLPSPPQMPEIRCSDCDCLLDYEKTAIGTGDGFQCQECSFKDLLK